MKVIERLNTSIDCCEIVESYHKDEDLKDRIIHVTLIESESPKVEFGVVDDWGSVDDVKLNSLLGSLIGYSIISDIKKKYNAHKKAGIVYYDDIRAGLAYEYQVYVDSGGTDGLSIYDIIHLEDLWEICIGRLLRGDWMTCVNTFSLIPVDAVFTQEVKDLHLNTMNNYIAGNY